MSSLQRVFFPVLINELEAHPLTICIHLRPSASLPHRNPSVRYSLSDCCGNQLLKCLWQRLSGLTGITGAVLKDQPVHPEKHNIKIYPGSKSMHKRNTHVQVETLAIPVFIPINVTYDTRIHDDNWRCLPFPAYADAGNCRHASRGPFDRSQNSGRPCRSPQDGPPANMKSKRIWDLCESRRNTKLYWPLCCISQCVT